MRNSYFNIVVKNLLKYRGKVIGIEILKKMLTSIMDDAYNDQKLYKIIYYLKNRLYIISLKKNIYFVKNPENDYDNQSIIDMFYRNSVKRHCKEFLMSDWYIGGLKALELNLSSFDVLDDLLIVNRYKQSTEIIIFDKKVIYKKYYVESKKMFNMFFKFTKKIYIKNNVFNVANLELSLLESLYNPSDQSMMYIKEIVKKALRKYKKDINYKVLEKILMNNKHHSSINRLYKIAKDIDSDLSYMLSRIIKRYSYFINV